MQNDVFWNIIQRRFREKNSAFLKIKKKTFLLNSWKYDNLRNKITDIFHNFWLGVLTNWIDTN